MISRRDERLSPRSMIILLALSVLSGTVALAMLVLRPDRAANTQILPVSLRSKLEANYGIDEHPRRIAPLGLQLVEDTIAGDDASGAGAEQRFQAMMANLNSPVPSAGGGQLVPSGQPPEAPGGAAPPVSSSPEPTATPVMVASATLPVPTGTPYIAPLAATVVSVEAPASTLTPVPPPTTTAVPTFTRVPTVAPPTFSAPTSPATGPQHTPEPKPTKEGKPPPGPPEPKPTKEGKPSPLSEPKPTTRNR